MLSSYSLRDLFRVLIIRRRVLYTTSEVCFGPNIKLCSLPSPRWTLQFFCMEILLTQRNIHKCTLYTLPNTWIMFPLALSQILHPHICTHLPVEWVLNLIFPSSTSTSTKVECTINSTLNYNFNYDFYFNLSLALVSSTLFFLYFWKNETYLILRQWAFFIFFKNKS